MSDFICGLASMAGVDVDWCKGVVQGKKIDTPVGAGCGSAPTGPIVKYPEDVEIEGVDISGQDAEVKGPIGPFTKDTGPKPDVVPFLDVVHPDLPEIKPAEVTDVQEVSKPEDVLVVSEVAPFDIKYDEMSYPDEISYPQDEVSQPEEVSDVQDVFTPEIIDVSYQDEMTLADEVSFPPDEISYPEDVYVDVLPDQFEVEVIGPQPLCTKLWEAGQTWADHYGGYPIITDLDNNGTKEIITWFWHGVWQDGNNDDWTRRLYVLDHNGENYPGWPLELTANTMVNSDTPYARLAAGDMDGDGDKEIVISDIDENDNLMVRAFHHDATPVEGWPIFGNELPESFSLADLDGDGKVELIGASNTFELYVFNSDGSLAPGWPKKIWGPFVNNFALGDIDEDGEAEIVTKGEGAQGGIHVYNYDGSEVANFPLDVPLYGGSGYYTGSPLIRLGDVDNNGTLDIVAQTYVGEANGIFIVNNQGVELYSFPIAEGFCASLKGLGDVDNDGDLEITVNNLCINPLYGEDLRIYHHDGTILNGWPLEVESNKHLFFSPIADLDGDGQAEIVGARKYGSSSVLPQFYIYNPDASLEANFNYKDSGNANIYEAAVVDLNNDGYLELITGGYDNYIGGKVKVWQCGPAGNWSAVQWPAFGHDAQWTWNYETPIN